MWDSYLDLKAFSRAFNLGRRAGRIHTQKGKSRNDNEKRKGSGLPHHGVESARYNPSEISLFLFLTR